MLELITVIRGRMKMDVRTIEIIKLFISAAMIFVTIVESLRGIGGYLSKKITKN